MSLNNLDVKKVYYYTICAIAFFVLMWGAIDFASASIGLAASRDSAASISASPEEPSAIPEKGEQFFDAYYQKKMLYDRLWDSLARIFISGIIFTYFRLSANRLEKE